MESRSALYIGQSSNQSAVNVHISLSWSILFLSALTYSLLSRTMTFVAYGAFFGWLMLCQRANTCIEVKLVVFNACNGKRGVR